MVTPQPARTGHKAKLLKHQLKSTKAAGYKDDKRGPTLESEHDKMLKQKLPDIQNMFSQYCRLDSLKDKRAKFSFKEKLIQNGSFVLDNGS